jgi:maleate cis-trans isomerase
MVVTSAASPMIDASRIGRFPRYAIGVLSPLAGSDTMPYGFYRLLGPDFIVISTSLALASFKPEDLDRAVAAIDDRLTHLVSRGADLIVQSGTPLALSLGPEPLQRLIERLRERSGLPVVSSALNAVAAARALGVKRLVVANKWNNDLNRALARFFAHWDIVVIASSAESREPAHFQSANLREGCELA